MLSRLKVGHRLVLAFGMLMLAIIVVAGVGTWRLAALYEANREISEEDMPLLQALASVQESVLQQANSVRDIVAQEDLKIHREAKKILKEKDEAIKSKMAEIRGLTNKHVTHEEEVIKKVDAALLRFQKETREALELVENAEYDMAKSHVFTKVRVTQNELSQQFSEFMRHKLSESDRLVAEARDMYHSAVTLMSIIALAAIGGGVFLAWFIGRGITSPLDEAVSFSRSISDGDLTRHAHAQGKDELASLMQAMNAMRESLVRMLQTVRGNAESVSSSSGRLAAQTAQIHGRSQDQSERAMRVSQSMTELTAAVSDISDSAGKVRDASQLAETLSREGNQLMKKNLEEVDSIIATVNSSSQVIGQLSESIEAIRNMAGIIKEIADQTNLLALNAAIEAARAGEQGRGFAVVADEVRKLAERTTVTTGEIAQTVGRISEQASAAVRSMDQVRENVSSSSEDSRQVGDMLSRILGSTENVTSLVEHIAEATREQLSVSEDTSVHMDEMARIAEETNVAVAQMADIASEMSAMSEELNHVVGRFRV